MVGLPAALGPGGSTGLRVRQTQNQVMQLLFPGLPLSLSVRFLICKMRIFTYL